ncbi:hypothetical protein O1R50_22715 [Glycomyces luteolus]|uniref:Uncharacterized protein n=1 Tax=Glycomyces luteolus TaxID=2670330 RepID=A0A9X3T5X2_9ACTN|nr:hypothetical protein [Glycomyces luteolus]MDA1362455.1 hypothetical protein [Glycomyces luteolus]
MSATPPFGPAYDEQPEDGQRPGAGQWRPQAGRPRGAQGEPGQQPNAPRTPAGGQPRVGGPQAGGPQAGGPQGGQRPMPQAGRPSQDPRGGVPRAGGPGAGRGPQPGQTGQSPQYQSPQQQFSPQSGGYESRRPQGGPVTGSTPRAEQWGAGSPPRRDAGSPPRREAGSPRGAGEPQFQPRGAEPGRAESPSPRDQPFEEAAFADESRSEWGGGETTTIGRLGYMPKEPRRRSDFQKVRSRARKSSPVPKIIGAVVALALVGGGVWWFMNRDDGGGEGTGGSETNLTYEGSSEPCSLVDTAPIESIVDGAEPEAVGDAEDKRSGWAQSCDLTYGEVERATALVEVESMVLDSDAKASVNFKLGTGDIGEQEAWTLVDPAPSIGDQSAAVSRVPEEGTSNFHLHVQDDNSYTVVRISVTEDAAMDQQGLTDLALAIANAYLENWRDAS